MTTSNDAQQTAAAAKKTTAAKKSTAAKTTAAKTTAAKTTAATKAAPTRRRAPRLRGVEAVRARLASEQTPIVFVGPTPFNLLGLDRWLPGLCFVSRHDPFDGAHPRLFAPTGADAAELVTGIDITNQLLGDAEVRAHLAAVEAETGAKPKITTVYADAETERLCAELGYDLITATMADRQLITDTIEPVVPEIVGGRPVTVAAVVTRRGTVIGSAVSSLVGDPALTIDPYAWCGAETHPRLLSAVQRHQASALVSDLGARLAEQGFRGYLETQLTVDDENGQVVLTAATPGIGAATAVSTTAAASYADLPLYALHVLEHLGVDFDLDVAELNRRAADLAVVDGLSQLVLSEIGTDSELLVSAPATGRYLIDELGRAHLVERSLDWHGLGESEFFFLRLAGPGDHRWLGADLGVVITRGPTPSMIISVRQEFVGVPTTPAYALDSLSW